MSGLSTSASSGEKIALFRELFRGRGDVFAEYWIKPATGASGYSPVCANEWKPGICRKPEVKCLECPHQAFLHLSDNAIAGHLQGRRVLGVYPLQLDDSCWFLAVDFDQGTWQSDVAAFLQTCLAFAVPHYVERSRSGNGAHVWFFFAAPVPATDARRLGSLLLTETMSRRRDLPMSSYDRLFPNQDTLPRLGLGNLIALPLQYGPRLKGNSVFVDPSWSPYSDQWALLASVQRIHQAELTALLTNADQTAQIAGLAGHDAEYPYDSARPWLPRVATKSVRPAIVEPLPMAVRVTQAQMLYIEKAGLPAGLANQIKRLAALQNPEFYRRQAMRRSTAQIPRIISCSKDLPRHIALPRGLLDALASLFEDYGVALELDDQRCHGRLLAVDFKGALTELQQPAMAALLAADCGVLVAPPGSGKSVVAAHLIASRRVNTLVIVNRRQLLQQWREQLALFLSLQHDEIGQIGDRRRQPTGQLDVATLQSLTRSDSVADIATTYGQVIVDECHHAASVSFERVLRQINARYIVGLTATWQRRDGLHPIVAFQLGPIQFSVDSKAQRMQQSIRHRLILRETGFRLSSSESEPSINEVYSQLIADEERNRLIVDDVAQALDQGRSPILLTERRAHLMLLAKRLEAFAPNLFVLHGGTGPKQRAATRERLARVRESEQRLLLATGKLIGEGFDDARLDTLFLALPVSWKGTLVQYAGRLHRRHQGKTEVRIFDYADRRVPVLERMLKRRLAGYRAIGYAADEASGNSAQIELDLG